LSGDPEKILEWQEKESLSRTERLRPDLLDR
jgi:tRNA G37 N-methylase TrmD